MMKTVRRVFLGGLVAVLPLAATAYVVYWIGSTAEVFFGWLFKAIFPDEYYVAGLGVALGVALIFAVGVLIHLWLVRRLMAWGNGVLNRVPLVKTVYGSVRDLLSHFGGSQERAGNQVGMVSLGDGDTRVLGVVTRTQFDDLPDGIGGEGDVAVYVPMSYQVGGFMVIVPRSRVTPIDVPFQEAMRLALTACMSKKEQLPDDAADTPAE